MDDSKTSDMKKESAENPQKTKTLNADMAFSRSKSAPADQQDAGENRKEVSTLSAEDVAEILSRTVFGKPGEKASEEQETDAAKEQTAAPEKPAAEAPASEPDKAQKETADAEQSETEAPPAEPEEAEKGAAEEPDKTGEKEQEPDQPDGEEPEPDQPDGEEPEPDETVEEKPEPDETVEEKPEPDETVEEKPESAETDAETGGKETRFHLPEFHLPKFYLPKFRLPERRGRGAADEEEAGPEEKPIRKMSEGALRVTTWVLIAVVVIAAALLIRLAVRKWNYHELQVVAEQTVDNPVSSSYVRFQKGVIRYSADSATYIDADQNNQWEVTYNMSAPKVDISGERAVIYDSEGSDLVICDENGETNRITTDLPVSRAVVSDIGTVAALMSDGNSTLICYYSSSGEEISTLRTNMSDPGYPLSLSVSDDGMLLAVSYLAYVDSSLESEVCVYSFDSEGQTKLDNIVGKFEFQGELVPEVHYFSDGSLVAFRDDGFTVIDGGSVPQIHSEVKTDSGIESLFYNDRYVGYVLQNDSDTEPFILNIFDLDGREITRCAFDFTYETVEFSGTQVSFYNRSRLCVYGTDGEKKFEGSCEGTPKQFLSVGTRQYVVSDDSGIKWLRLR